MTERFAVYLAGPGARTAHRKADCPILARRPIVANAPVEREAHPHLAGSVVVSAPGPGGRTRAIRLCASCGREGSNG